MTAGMPMSAAIAARLALRATTAPAQEAAPGLSPSPARVNVRERQPRGAVLPIAAAGSAWLARGHDEDGAHLLRRRTLAGNAPQASYR